MALSFNPSKRQGDIGFAAVLLAVAGLSFLKAADYPGASGTYPRVLSVRLALGAIAVVLRSLSRRSAESDAAFFTHPGRFLLGFGARRLVFSPSALSAT